MGSQRESQPTSSVAYQGAVPCRARLRWSGAATGGRWNCIAGAGVHMDGGAVEQRVLVRSEGEGQWRPQCRPPPISIGRCQVQSLASIAARAGSRWPGHELPMPWQPNKPPFFPRLRRVPRLHMDFPPSWQRLHAVVSCSSLRAQRALGCWSVGVLVWGCCQLVDTLRVASRHVIMDTARRGG